MAAAAAAAAAAQAAQTTPSIGSLPPTPPFAPPMPGLDPHFGGLLRMPLGGDRPAGFPGAALNALNAAAAAQGFPPRTPTSSHDFRVDQLMQGSPLGLPGFGGERPPLFGLAAAASQNPLLAGSSALAG